jgi:hypothetical protein
MPAPAAAPPGSSLAERFAAARRFTEELASELEPEDCTLQSMPEASPTRWHLAHTTWFFETFRESSSATSTSCAAAPAPRRALISGEPTATSSRRRRAGS